MSTCNRRKRNATCTSTDDCSRKKARESTTEAEEDAASGQMEEVPAVIQMK